MSTLQADPSALNEFFHKTAERLVGQNTTTDDVILSHIDSCTNSDDSFKLQKVTHNDILKSLKSLRNDCSTGYNNILVQITNFIETQQVYNKHQSGYRRNNSPAATSQNYMMTSK